MIPRPDTEVLVETVIGFVREKGIYRARILDVGTGSGCIAVSIAYYIKDSMVTAVDISEKALEIARQNALNSGVADRVTLVRSNLFKEITSHKKYDIIVSNPPYIRTADIKTLQREVRDFEPLEALDGGADGMDFYRKIVYDSVKYIRPFGMLAFEVGYDQARKVCSIMERYYHDIRIIRDYAGVERVVAGIFKHEL